MPHPKTAPSLSGIFRSRSGKNHNPEKNQEKNKVRTKKKNVLHFDGGFAHLFW